MMFSIEPIAFIKGCFPDKFGIPRQPSLSPHSKAQVIFTKAYQNPDYIRGIESYSHLWLIFSFHHHIHALKTPLVRPQRLGGNSKLGVFATRATYRPNNLGLSVVKLDSIRHNPLILNISAHDLCDNTPIFDIKPYLPFNDAQSAYSDFVVQSPPIFKVDFSTQALESLETIIFQNPKQYPYLKNLIIEVVSQDPRPSYHAKNNSFRIYGVRLYEFDIQFTSQKQANLLDSTEFLIIDIRRYKKLEIIKNVLG